MRFIRIFTIVKPILPLEIRRGSRKRRKIAVLNLVKWFNRINVDDIASNYKNTQLSVIISIAEPESPFFGRSRSRPFLAGSGSTCETLTTSVNTIKFKTTFFTELKYFNMFYWPKIVIFVLFIWEPRLRTNPQKVSLQNFRRRLNMYEYCVSAGGDGYYLPPLWLSSHSCSDRWTSHISQLQTQPS